MHISEITATVSSILGWSELAKCLLVHSAFNWLSIDSHTYVLRVVVVLLTHYSDVIMRAMMSQITGVSVVYSTICSGVDQRKYQSSMSLGSPVTSELPAQRASNAENVSIWWHHHDLVWYTGILISLLLLSGFDKGGAGGVEGRAGHAVYPCHHLLRAAACGTARRDILPVITADQHQSTPGPVPPNLDIVGTLFCII